MLLLHDWTDNNPSPSLELPAESREIELDVRRVWNSAYSITGIFLGFLFLYVSTCSAVDYAIVISNNTRSAKDWSLVVDTLVQNHFGKVLEYDQSVTEVLPSLRECFPRYTCFVAQSTEANAAFVKQVHQLTRQFDDDPYADTFWGILTGYDAANALAIASCQTPLVIQKVAGGTAFAMEMATEGIWYDELIKNKIVRKEPGGSPQQQRGPDDTTQAMVDLLNNYRPDLFITSGHATQRDWQIGYRFRSGRFISKAGQMYGVDTQDNRLEINSPNPKVYLPIGNCLMGNIDGPDAMALAWMNDVGVKQMLGYTVPTWFGYMGWGVLDYFLEQPGRYTLTEAFFANYHALVHRLHDPATAQGELRGLLYDLDTVAFYGDPAWSAKMEDRPKYYDQELRIEGDLYTLTITPKRGEKSFQPVNTNGSQRGWRPIIQFLPQRCKDIRLLTGQNLKPVITDNFILIPNPHVVENTSEYRVSFQAQT
ncbi:MAG: hypothetical protein JXA82_19070 [Sedimentisphaerales bacterium]|nr:hypothetical protein [Sedimentisphaerales bacterium]